MHGIFSVIIKKIKNNTWVWNEYYIFGIILISDIMINYYIITIQLGKGNGMKLVFEHGRQE